MNQNASRFGLFSNSSSSDNNNVMCLRIKPDKDDASSGYDSPGEYFIFNILLTLSFLFIDQIVEFSLFHLILFLN